MSKKTLKLVTQVGGEEVVVGRCHPGQARILKKFGFADFVKGKVVLRNTPQALRVAKEDSAIRKGWVRGSVFSKPFKEQNSWVEEGIDQEGELGPDKPHPIEHRCSSFMEWVDQIQERRALGHWLIPADDPMRHLFGFVDDKANMWVTCGLSCFKQVNWDEVPNSEILRKAMTTSEGRYALVMGESATTPTMGDAPPAFSPEQDAELEALMMDGALELKEQYEAQEKIRLADEWAGVWTEDMVRRACGLMSQIEWLCKRNNWIDAMDEDDRAVWRKEGAYASRRTGRTTEMLLKAVAASILGEDVVILGFTSAFAKGLATRAKTMATACGYPAVQIEGLWEHRATTLRGRGATVFQDHN